MKGGEHNMPKQSGGHHKSSGGHHKSSGRHHKSSSPRFQSSGFQSSSPRFQSSSPRFRSSSPRNTGRGIGLAGRVFIQTAVVGTTHTIVLIGGQVYTGVYAGVFNGLIRLTGATGPGVAGGTINIGPNAVIAFT